MKTRSTAETTSRSLLRFFLTCMTLNAATLTAVEVSVCRDATYELAVDAASLCAGAGAEPAGRHCPKAGDVAVDDCLSTLPSFTNGRCVLPEDAVCQVVNDQETWGCVLPSVGCNHTEIQSEETGRCETWDFSSNSSTDGVELLEDYARDGNESWFEKTTELRELYNCGDRPTPAPTRRAHRRKVDKPETNKRNQTTTMSGSGDTDEEEQEAEVEVPVKKGTDRDVVEIETEEDTKVQNTTHTLAPKVATTVAPTLMPGSLGCNGSLSDEDDENVEQVDELEVGQEESAAGHLTTVTFAAETVSSFGGLSDEALAAIAAMVAVAAVVVTVFAVVYARKRRRLEDAKGEGDADVGDAEDEAEGKDDGDEKDESKGIDDSSEKDKSDGKDDGNVKDESEVDGDADTRVESEGDNVGSETRAFSLLVPPTPAVLLGRLATTPVFAGAKANVATTPTATTPTVASTGDDLPATTSDDHAFESIQDRSGDNDDGESALAGSSDTGGCCRHDA
uniref:RxLR effector candidate protein n=1 Tax=Hyaloperonospora arabidopsidis (strain Emoy2) TaxID=559515 RepID=M4BEY2_HYAAE